MILPILIILLSSALNSPAQCKQSLQQYLLSQNFQGKWRQIQYQNTTLSSSSAWSYIEGNQGIAMMHFNEFGKNTNIIQSVSLDLLMPKYYDKKFLRLLILLEPNFQQNGQNWSGKQNVSCTLFNEAKQIQNFSEQISFFVDQSIIGIMINDRTFITIIYQPKYLSPYSSSVFAGLSFVLFLIVRRKGEVNTIRIKHQVVSIIMPCVLNILISGCQLSIGLRSLFGKMSPEAFFTVSGCINLATCFQIVRFYWPILFHKKWSIIIVWILAGLYGWFLLYFRHNYICLVINSLVLIPQIVYHCLKGQKIELDIRFLIFAIFNQFYVIYFKSCPSNIFKQSPNFLVLYCVLSLLISQAGVLIAQTCIGSRFFIPAILLPLQYDYYNTSKFKDAKIGIECHICLQQIILQEKKKGKIMVTPCNHVFHSQCLQKWMVVQMKCPVDRFDLPAF